MDSNRQTVRIESRFRGPPESANGGYTAGIVAGALDGPCEITLRAPPPLDTDLTLTADGDCARLRQGERVIAEAHLKPLDVDPPPSPGFAAARAVRENYAGFRAHNFPGCFVCGPQRDEGDGLHIFAAPHDDLVVAPWRPAASLRSADRRVDQRYVHAALDCPSYFALRDDHLLALLGRMHSAVFEVPEAGEECVVVAWPIAHDGRKHRCGAAVYGRNDRLLAVAVNTWIELKESLP
jgi:hypothetical protein